MIYIDPPYNTGNEFIYPDNFREGIEDYLRYSGQANGEGMKLSTNTETSGRYHSAWLNMMYPRLFLARNLLREDGVIFVSIDDHEVHNLRAMMDEIFGEENLIAQLVWKSRQNKDNRNVTGASIDHEYVLCYGRRIRGDIRKTEQYANLDNDPRGDWTSANMVGLLPEDQRPNLHYELVNPETGINYDKPEMGWRYDRKTMAELIEDNRILWPDSPSGRPRRKVFLNELQTQFTGFSSLIGADVYTRNGTAEISELFGQAVMDFPKPAALLTSLIEQGAEADDLILDFFAGSCATAQASLELNVQGGGDRKFIMVQLPEPTHNPEFPTIADIGKERIRRVAKKLNDEDDGKLKSEDEPSQDRGFKVFKLTSSNFKIWDGTEASEEPEDLAEQLQAFAENVLPDRTREDILFEILLKSGLPLTAEVERLEVAGREVYAVSGGLLMVCLEDHVDEELVRAVTELEPSRFVCLDAAFDGNDKLKTNTVLQMKDSGIEFRTV
jgi:adenine-specific DNA-methyltransferase